MSDLGYRYRIRTASAEHTSAWMNPFGDTTLPDIQKNPAVTRGEVRKAVVEHVSYQLRTKPVITILLEEGGWRNIAVAAIEWFEVDVEARTDRKSPGGGFPDGITW